MEALTVKIGVVGFSRNAFDQATAKQLLWTHFAALQARHRDRIVEIVSGYTAQGVPRIAYELAEEFNFVKVGFSAKQAFRVRTGLYPCDKEIIVGERFGDESEAFVGYIDGLVRIGGGPQSRREVELFKALYAGTDISRRLIEEEVTWFGK